MRPAIPESGSVRRFSVAPALRGTEGAALAPFPRPDRLPC